MPHSSHGAEPPDLPPPEPVHTLPSMRGPPCAGCSTSHIACPRIRNGDGNVQGDDAADLATTRTNSRILRNRHRLNLVAGLWSFVGEGDGQR